MSPACRRRWPAPTTPTGPDRTAPVVQRLIEAGAIFVGKTNLDQFATGLNGTRTPYPLPRSVYGGNLISGGSSSGSALAVATGEVPFTVATDTAGSGRVPPALNGIVGLQAVPRADQHRRAGAGLPVAGLHQPDRPAHVPDLGGRLRRGRRGRRCRDPYTRPRRRDRRRSQPDSGSACRMSANSSSSATTAMRDGPSALPGQDRATFGNGRSRPRSARSWPPVSCCTRGHGSPSGWPSSATSWPSNPDSVLPVIRTILRGRREILGGGCVLGRTPARRAAGAGRRALAARWTCSCCRRSAPPSPSTRCWPTRSGRTPSSATTPTSATCSTCARRGPGRADRGRPPRRR